MPIRFSTVSASFMDAAELRSRCAAAARLAMRGQNYSTEERADCAALIAAEVLSVGQHNHRAPAAEVLRFITWAMDHPATVGMLLAEDVAGLPASAATFTRLHGMAANYRRGLDRRRIRDAEHAADVAARDAFLPNLPSEEPITRSTPAAARRLALDMLRDLGMLSGGDTVRRDASLSLPTVHAHGRPSDVLSYVDRVARILEGNAWPVAWRAFLAPATPAPAPRAESPSGPLWTAAYAAARAASGLDAEAIADELDITYGTLRNHLSVAAGKLPSVAAGKGIAEHADALSAPEPTAHKATWTRNRSADLATDWRTRPEEAAPVHCSAGEVATPAELPDWTRDLAPNTARRLAHAAELRRARMAAKTPAERETSRLSAGLPATVR